MKKFFWFLILIIFCVKVVDSQPCKVVIGYYPGWQWYDRNKVVRPSTIQYEKYSVINYAFYQPNSDGTISGTDSWADENILLGQINWSTNPVTYYPNTSLVDLAHNHNVKVLISVGGWTLSYNFPSIAANATKRATFAHSCVQLIAQYNLDGIDIDWEYPAFATNGGTAADVANFPVFLQQIRDSIDNYGASINKTMLLTACVGASFTNMSNVQWNLVSEILDYINLMSYDYFGPWDAISNHNSPLYAPAQGDPTFNINSSVNQLLTTYNVPASKLTAGIPFYGRSVKTSGTPGLHVATMGTADYSTFGIDDGTPLYYNVMLKMNLFTQHWDNVAQVPYLTGIGSLNTFVSYDNVQSVAQKAQYVINHNLAGIIIWEITGDYIETSSGSGVIASTPLIDTINAVFCNTVTDIQQNNTNKRIAIFPNPVYTILNITTNESEFEKFSYTISNVVGQQMMSGFFNKNSSKTIIVKNLPEGLYFITLTNENYSFSQKFCKE